MGWTAASKYHNMVDNQPSVSFKTFGYVDYSHLHGNIGAMFFLVKKFFWLRAFGMKKLFETRDLQGITNCSNRGITVVKTAIMRNGFSLLPW